jgi:hypothetical protein
MAFSVNDNGTWKTVKKLSVNDGTWKAVKSGWINKNGVWSKFYSGTTTVNVTSQNNINLRTLYTNQTGDSSSNAVSVIFNINGNIGSTSTGTASMVTGTWAAGSEIVVNIAAGVYVVGAGGNGSGVNGGDAVSLSYNVSINNLGIIGGGGGGGGNSGGGGGAGSIAGTGGSGGSNGTLTSGGAGAATSFTCSAQNPWCSNNYQSTFGSGGSLGNNGTSGRYFAYVNCGSTRCTSAVQHVLSDVTYPGGTAGKAVALNSNTVTWSPQGMTYGSIS